MGKSVSEMNIFELIYNYRQGLITIEEVNAQIKIIFNNDKASLYIGE